MSEETVKFEIEVPTEIQRFLNALEEFTGIDIDEYLSRLLVQAVRDSIDENTWSHTRAIDFGAVREKYGLEASLQKVLDP